MFVLLLRIDSPLKISEFWLTSELAPFGPEPESSLLSARHTLQFETANNDAIIVVHKTKEVQEFPPFINPWLNQEASIHNLENQIGQLAKIFSETPLGALPSNIEKNLREHAKAVTLRSGKKLVETPSMAVDKEKENVQATEEFTSIKEDEVQ
ncbi:hypothetical protein M9H77_04349 [Catharanthus roseus]|uniref:Uncharacterized protein n=1 Tax=Catharanthus roseus TaxID=4058 RepID=A0ACC0CDU8_CATRO|nr:hypothetical protein M9H77_04349 [Catharanthus roseus]